MRKQQQQEGNSVQQKQKEQHNNQDNQQDRQNNEEQDSDQDQGQNNQKWKKIEKPEQWINLYMIDFNQCDGKKCTGRKMQRFNMLKAIKDKKKKFKGVVLSALGDRNISLQDLDICLKYGICVIDCSWNRIEETNQFRFKNQRILPYVVAGNPVNYGKPFQLSCVQALATALCTINYIPQAEYIMSKFGWSDGFWSINQCIKQYAVCKTVQDIEKMSLQHQQAENTMKQNYISDSDQEDSDSSNSQQQKEENQNIDDH